MNLIIDASNIKAGGGLTHLKEVLHGDAAVKEGFKKVFLWAPDNSLEKISDKRWLEKCSHPWLNGSYLTTLKWKKKILEPFVREKKALLFIPGTGNSQSPYVTMCQNLLPLDSQEMNRYFPSKDWFRLLLLNYLHIKSYQKAEGIIFLTQYCRDILPLSVSQKIKQEIVIPHGLNKRFLDDKVKERNKTFSNINPFKLIYVSIIDVYKHQRQVAEAVYHLREEGYHIQLDLIGPAYPPALKKLQRIIALHEGKEGVTYHGMVPYEQLHNFYQVSDAFIFASTCETYGMVITEAMAAGLPILCSERSSMPETVQNAGIYFDPLEIESIKDAILRLYSEPHLRVELSKRSLEKAKALSWEKCASKTFGFLANISRKVCVE